MINNILASGSFTIPEQYVLSNENGDTVLAGALFNKPTLVFRFNELNCEDCIQKHVQLLQEKLKNNPVNVIGLASYQNKRIFKMVKKKYGIQMPIYFVPLEESPFVLSGTIEENNHPYLFVMDKSLEARYIFMPSTDFTEAASLYVDRISRLLQPEHANSIDWDKRMIDLGTAQLDKKKTAVFAYTNLSDTPLVIRDVVTVCGCTVPEWDKKPLSKGDSASLVVHFTPIAQGYNVKRIFIYHNLSKNPSAVTIKAIVTE